jgi:hypothetical protein
MLVEMRPIASIRPYENNPRINDAAVDAVAASLQAFGWRQPLVVDEEGVIIVGHTRYKAALKLGWTEPPVHVAAGLTPAQAKAYRIADNRTAQLSGWDDDKLPLELMGLQEAGFDLDLTWFSGDELLRLLGSEANDGQGDPDAIPEPPDEAVTQPGDLWLLGKHRLLCGDVGPGHGGGDKMMNGSTDGERPRAGASGARRVRPCGRLRVGPRALKTRSPAGSAGAKRHFREGQTTTGRAGSPALKTLS